MTNLKYNNKVFVAGQGVLNSIYTYLQKRCDWYDFGVCHACPLTCSKIASMSGKFLAEIKINKHSTIN